MDERRDGETDGRTDATLLFGKFHFNLLEALPFDVIQSSFLVV